MKKVLITGITGKSGSYLLENIITNKGALNGYHFGFIVRNKEKAEVISKQFVGCDVFVGDLEDKAFLSTVFSEDYTILLHIAGIQKTLHLVEVALSIGKIKWLILVHTTGIYSKYKAAGEMYRQIESRIDRLIEEKDIAKTILRPTMIYGNIHDKNVAIFMKMVYKLRIFPVVNNANYELQPVWCGDLGRAYYLVLTHPDVAQNKDYILSGGKPILLIDMFKVMANKLGVTNRFVNVPFWFAYSLSWILFVVSFGKMDFREKVQRLVEPRVYSHEQATKDFGYNPVNFEEGIDAEIEEFKVSLSK